GNAATMRIGSRFPILNASFAPIFNSAAVSQVIQNQSFQAPFPSFSYEDLGVTVKATPLIQGDSTIRLDLEMQIRALSAQSLNSVPVISNREYKGSISVKEGEPAVVVGSISNTESKSLRGLPGFSHLPVFKYLTSRETKEQTEGELLVVITPHIARIRDTSSTDVLVVPGGSR
ncbi:MAG TPA: hypothetical protein VGQ19_18690, partial [Burkholderiales bacterium]|nr:hypothetical protein [Burkholderiales bacterium]